MADMWDCGVYTYESWRRGDAYTCRWLGPFDPNLSREEIDKRLENEKLTPSGVEEFWRGFNAAKLKHEVTANTTN